MPSTIPAGIDPRSTLWPILAGFVIGCALQLQQAALWVWPVYAGLALAALVLGWNCGKARISSGAVWRAAAPWGLGIAALAFGSGCVGLRASTFLAQGLDPVLEGRDLSVTGVIGAMPQRNETGVRFMLEVESAQLDGRSVNLPAKLQLAWYAGVGGGFDAGNMLADLQRQPADLRAGERWQMMLRVKAPHGNSNPHGFDYELWLWEQGVQATAYVRAGSRDVAPRRWGQTWQHPVEAIRQNVRDAIFERVPDRQQAGLIAALVVGDQNAIERADWDVFRATGVAHLMRIWGLVKHKNHKLLCFNEPLISVTGLVKHNKIILIG